MTVILFIIGILVSFIFRKDWKKAIYLLAFMVPYFGIIQINILGLTKLAALVQDITVILPIYFLFILARLKKKDIQFYLPSYFKNFLLFFIVLVILFTINPFFEPNLIVRLVGVKVWIFYLLFILIGFEFIESELELKKFCNFFAIVSIVPCVIGILQYLGSYYIGHLETMVFFYNGNETLAKMTTQNLARFDWGAGVKIFRLPSTFSFAAQYHGFTLTALVPAIFSVGFSNTPKEKFFYSIIVIIVILGTFASGHRASTVYYLLFFTFLILIQTRFYVVLFFSVLMFVMLSLVNLDAFPYLQSIVVNVTDVTAYNFKNYLLKDYGFLLSNYFFGGGVGLATPEARYVVNPGEVGSFFLVHEGLYHKAIQEMGILGLLAVIAFLVIIVYENISSIRFLKNHKISLFCSVLLAFFLLSIIISLKGASMFTKYPSNFLVYFYLGMAIKLRYLNLDDKR